MPQKSLTTHTRELAPAFNYHIEGFYYAGGVQGLILCITDLLDTGTMTVTGRFKQNPSTARVYNERIFGPGRIHIVRRGTDCALYGNLAPDSAVVKSGAVAPEMLVHGGGRPGCSTVEEDAATALSAQAIRAGDVVVTRCEGAKDGPGMREMLGCTDLLKGLSLDRKM